MTIPPANNDHFDSFYHLLYLFRLFIHSAGVSPPGPLRTAQQWGAGVVGPALPGRDLNGSVSGVSPTPALG